MLETTRRRGATIALYLVFGVLIAVFALNFGPQSGSGGQGCGGADSNVTVEIAEKGYGMPTWRWAFNTRGQGSYGSRVIAALDGLMRRELLAQEAEARGLRIDDDLVDQKITAGDVWVLTEYIDGKPLYFEDGEFFNYKMLERNLVGRFGLSIGGFKAEQRRELLASMMTEVLSAGGRASRDEAFAQFQHVHNTITADAVAFSVEAYKAKVIVTDADVARWLSDHTTEVQARYDADKSTAYTAMPRKVRVRRVFVERAPAEETQPVSPGAIDPDAPPPETPPTKPDPAVAKLEAARAEIVAKKKSFADVARALDSDETARARGGDLGWLLPDAPGLGDPALGEALKTLVDKVGEPSAVIDTPRGFYLLVVEDSREGDLAFDQVKLEIAASLALDAWADEAARRAAIAAVTEARAGTGKNLADMFEKGAAAPQVNPEQQLDLEDLIKNNPDLDPATIEQIRQMLQQQGGGGSGALEIESADVPVEWSARAQADGPSAAPVASDPPAGAGAAARARGRSDEAVGRCPAKVRRGRQGHRAAARAAAPRSRAGRQPGQVCRADDRAVRPRRRRARRRHLQGHDPHRRGVRGRAADQPRSGRPGRVREAGRRAGPPAQRGARRRAGERVAQGSLHRAADRRGDQDPQGSAPGAQRSGRVQAHPVRPLPGYPVVHAGRDARVTRARA